VLAGLATALLADLDGSFCSIPAMWLKSSGRFRAFSEQGPKPHRAASEDERRKQDDGDDTASWNTSKNVKRPSWAYVPRHPLSPREQTSCG
jgi:hypothetical protein